MWLWIAPLSAAHATPPGVSFEWQKPTVGSCPRASVLQRDVEQALGRPVFTSRSAARLHILGISAQRATGTWVRLEARNMAGRLLGRRELQARASDCGALRNDLSLVLTLLLDHEREATSPAPQLAVGLWTGYLANTFPSGLFGVGPALSLGLGSSVQLRADAAYWLPTALQTEAGIHARLQAVTVGLRLCPRIVGAERWTLHACAGAQAGVLIALQTQPEGLGTQLRLLAHGRLELMAALRVGDSARIELTAGPIVSLQRTNVVVTLRDDSQVSLYRAPLFGLSFALAWLW